MTIEEVKKLTDKELNIKIAQLCGIKIESDGIQDDLMACRLGVKGYDPSGKFLRKIPNYTGDLNAMHEAEEIIRKIRLWYQYCLNLPGRSFDESIGATARQRAEAFVLTLSENE